MMIISTRTAMNYQYKNGGNLTQALSKLYNEGGIPRLYQGIGFALLQGPLSRFGDTAANALALSLIDNINHDNNNLHIPIFIQTGLGSILAGSWRWFLSPIDNFKTISQVQGKKGIDILIKRFQTSSNPLSILYSGALASAIMTILGHYPWFLLYNTLSTKLPEADTIAFYLAASNNIANDNSISINGVIDDIQPMMVIDRRVVDILRSALIGICASSFSDVVTNSVRVLKTSRQTSFTENNNSDNGGNDDKGNNDINNNTGLGYIEIAKDIIARDGIVELMTRGLEVRYNIVKYFA
jgi:hypothetical protein